MSERILMALPFGLACIFFALLNLRIEYNKAYKEELRRLGYKDWEIRGIIERRRKRKKIERQIKEFQKKLKKMKKTKQYVSDY